MAAEIGIAKETQSTPLASSNAINVPSSGKLISYAVIYIYKKVGKLMS